MGLSGWILVGGLVAALTVGLTAYALTCYTPFFEWNRRRKRRAHRRSCLRAERRQVRRARKDAAEELAFRTELKKIREQA